MITRRTFSTLAASALAFFAAPSVAAPMKRLVGDGVTDDSAALNASLAGEPVLGPDGSIVRLHEPYSGELPVPPVAYLIDSTLEIVDGSRLIAQRGARILEGANCRATGRFRRGDERCELLIRTRCISSPDEFVFKIKNGPRAPGHSEEVYRV